MKDVGVVICNYNKQEYVVRCIQSVLESKYQDFDLYVVDNASTDNSVECIQQMYGDRLKEVSTRQLQYMLYNCDYPEPLRQVIYRELSRR